MRLLAGRAALWAPVALYMAAIFVASSVQAPPEVGPGATDKVLHAIVYAGLSVVVLRALSVGWIRTVTPQLAMCGALIATLYGVSDELHQSFVPGRQMDAYDVLANAVGAGIASSALWAWGIIRKRDGL